MFSLAIHNAKAEQIKSSAIAARAAQMKQTDFKKFMRGS